jgi:ribosome-binding factor A
MADSIRIQRLSSILRRRIAEVLEHELSDPRARLVTITRVKLAKDLSTCIAFYSAMGTPGQLSAVGRMLEHASGYVQREAARVLKTRTTPRLSFQFDPSIIGAIEMTQKIDAALREDRVRRGLPPEDPGPVEGEELPDGDTLAEHDDDELDEDLDDDEDDEDLDDDEDDEDDDEDDELEDDDEDARSSDER